ncbi:PHP domain-containing protein [Candidatus Woesearchaeota archaeon]|nr:MAG: PHP domain-containing protein [Candidatus Woesearchaeota archaeon]
MLKIEFHCHTNYLHENETSYNPKQVIDYAAKLGYDILCLSEHYSPICTLERFRRNPLQTTEDFKDYAKSKGILLIPSTEYYFPEGEVLLVNIKKKHLQNILTIEDLQNLPDSVLRIAPHPFYNMSNCLGKNLFKHKDNIDALEYSFFYNRFYNKPNIKAERVSKLLNKPIVGTSDLHDLSWLGYTYTLADSKKTANSIVKAVKTNNISVITRALPLTKYLYTFYFHTLRDPIKFSRKLYSEFILKPSKSP